MKTPTRTGDPKETRELNALRSKSGGAISAVATAEPDAYRAGNAPGARGQGAEPNWNETSRRRYKDLRVLPTLPETWWRNEGAAKNDRPHRSADQTHGRDLPAEPLELIDQKAALDKEEATLEPLVEAETLDESKAAAQLDRVAQARAELEKTRGRMLLGIRKQLDMEQWRKLKDTRTIVEKMTLR